jgi:MSHA biogenesis protein MshP
MTLSGIKFLSRGYRQAGFTLITAIFLLVVVASLSVYILSLRSVQQTTLVYSVQGARAMQAARAGIQWGVYQAITTNSCPTTNLTFSPDGAALSAFQVVVSCLSSDHQEAAETIRVFRIESTATTTSFTYGSLDFVFRRLGATVSPSPP